MPPIYYPYFELNLHNTLLSTESFQQLFHSGISNFAGSDLTQVDLQAILHKKSLYLDFSNVNLENSNLKELDFSQIKLYGSNLKNTHLVNSLFSSVHLDESVNIEGAELTRFAAFTEFLNAGIKRFDECKIIEFDTISQVDNTYILQLEEVSFRKTQFIGHFNDIDFISCDLRHAKFIPLSPPTSHPSLLSNLKFFDCRLEKIEFHQIKFMEPFKLQDCSLREVILKNIEMPASILFKFYQSGHRNFESVHALKGKIPEKLPPMPLLQASLSKQAFIHLYKQGVRDFSASNLCGFLLSEVLVKEGISEINLKLEGAHYRQSLLGCASSSQSLKRTKRSPSPPLCNFYFILQKANSKKTVGWQDLLDNLDESKYIFKEVVLGPKPFYRLQNPDTLNFYWGYTPDNEALAQAVDFVEKSTEPAQRSTAQLYFYFLTVNSPDTVKDFAKNLYQLGFRKGQLIYPITKNQLTGLDLTAKSVPIIVTTKFQDKFFSIKEKPSLTPTIPKNWRTNMQRRIANMKTTLKGSLRYSLQEGTQYDLALVLMDLIALWLYQVDTPEPKDLDVTTRLALQEFASQTVDQEAIQHRANDHQHGLTLRLALQCIERGECSTPELVEANIINTLQTLKPDVQIGFEVMWEKIKKALFSLGEMVSQKFKDIEKNFRLSHSVFTMVQRYKTSNAHSNHSMKSKRKIYDWYEQPQLTYFIKTIELVFIELGYDLNNDPNFSESLLAGYLYDVWFALAKKGISEQTPSSIILQTLENRSFRQSILDRSYLVNDKIYYSNTTKTKEEENLTIRNNSSSKIPRLQSDPEYIRTKRFLSPQAHQEQRILNIADDYLVNYDRRSEKKIYARKTFKKNLSIATKLNKSKYNGSKKPYSKQTIKKPKNTPYLPSVKNSKKSRYPINLVKPLITMQQKPLHEIHNSSRFFTTTHLFKEVSSSPASYILMGIKQYVQKTLGVKNTPTPNIHLSNKWHAQQKSNLQVTHHIDVFGTLLLFKMSTTQKNLKPAPSPQIAARYKKVIRKIEKLEAQRIYP